MTTLLNISSLSVLIAIATVFSVAHAETTADAVIDRYIDVSGGVETIEKLENMTGSILMNMPNAGMSLQMKMVTQHPNLMYVEQTIPGIGAMKQGCNGTIGWATDPIQGNRQLMPGELDELIKEASPKWVLQMKDRFSVRKVASETDTEITLTLQEDADSPAETWIFSKESGFLIAQDRIADMGPSGKLPMKMTFSDYREMSGMMVPFKTSANNPAFSFTMELQSLEFNTAIDQSIFEPPF